MLTGIPHASQHSQESPLTIAVGNQKSINTIKELGNIVCGLQAFSFNLFDFQLHIVTSHRRMKQGFTHGFVAVIWEILSSHNADGYLPLGILELTQEIFPRSQISLSVGQAKARKNLCVQALTMEFQGQLVHGAMYIY